MDLISFEKNQRLVNKLDSLELRYEKLQDLIDEGSFMKFSKKAKTLARLQRVLFKRYKLVNGQELERATSAMRTRFKALRREATKENLASSILVDLEDNRAILDQAIFSAKAEAMGFTEQESGIFGQVDLLEGNCMPGPGLTSCKRSGLSTRVTIRPLTSIHQSLDAVYFEFNEEPIAAIEASEEGYYALELEPGFYSVFVEDNGREYCKSADWLGNACAITVSHKSKLEYDLLVDHVVH